MTTWKEENIVLGVPRHNVVVVKLRWILGVTTQAISGFLTYQRFLLGRKAVTTVDDRLPVGSYPLPSMNRQTVQVTSRAVGSLLQSLTNQHTMTGGMDGSLL